MQPAILLADDNAEILARVTEILAQDFRVVDAVQDSRSLVRRAVDLRPDVIVMDVSVAGSSGLTAAGEIHRQLPGVRFIFLTMQYHPDLCRHALPDFEFGYVLKPFAATDLVIAVREALQGRCFISPSVANYSDDI